MKNEVDYEYRYFNPLKVDLDPYEECLQNY